MWAPERPLDMRTKRVSGTDSTRCTSNIQLSLVKRTCRRPKDSPFYRKIGTDRLQMLRINIALQGVELHQDERLRLNRFCAVERFSQ